MARRRRPPRSGAISELPPLKIASQLLALQAVFYATALVLTLFASLVAGTDFSLDLVFGWQGVRGDTTTGWMAGFLWVVDGGFVLSIAIVILVARSKLVLDFALSVHAIHLLVASLYSRQIPRNAAWWLAMAASSALGVALGVWGCRYRELRPITFGGGGGAKTQQANGSATGGSWNGDGEGSSGGNTAGGGGAEGGGVEVMRSRGLVEDGGGGGGEMGRGIMRWCRWGMGRMGEGTWV
ncbi:integral membrane protein S linking to the trans Golgi network-domain-containing protein [Coniochaeta sp. 2T2.1]|nr:integral membrane protein S linking to the trans Golgi network-domain-containing protein [Coniochaeta sp. 2T2.1]